MMDYIKFTGIDVHARSKRLHPGHARDILPACSRTCNETDASSFC